MQLNSKEALENVKTAPSFMGGNPRYWTYLNSQFPFLEDIETIKQDLNRLEKLEKENQELLVNKNVAQGIAIKLKEENDKLKKAIKILKDKNVDIYKLLNSKNLFDYNSLTWATYDFGGDELTQEEYDLLKEVLGND